MQRLKSTVKTLVNRFGYDIVRHEEKCERPLNVLDIVVRDRLRLNQPFYFVYIGAFDGVRSDLLRPLILKYNLKGLLVEPLPDFFEELCQNYASEPQLIFENCAVATENGKRSMFRFKRNAPVPHEFFHGLARFDKDYIVNRARQFGLDDYVEEIIVSTLTFSSLLQKHNIKKVTLLQIDTEGYDYEILKMAFDANVFPEIINYEWTELTQRDRFECRCMLLENNYSFIDVGPDTLAVRDRAWE